MGSRAGSRKQGVRRKPYQTFYHRQTGGTTLGFSFHRSPSAGKREEIQKPEQYSLKYKYQVLLDGVLEEPWPRPSLAVMHNHKWFSMLQCKMLKMPLFRAPVSYQCGVSEVLLTKRNSLYPSIKKHAFNTDISQSSLFLFLKLWFKQLKSALCVEWEIKSLFHLWSPVCSNLFPRGNFLHYCPEYIYSIHKIT